MRATVCELPDAGASDVFERQWTQLADHVHSSQSEWVLLPDMPFCEWFADSARADSTVWSAAVQAHDAWERRLADLAPAVILGSRPIDFGNERYDEAFIWESELGLRSVHAKVRVVGQVSREWAWYQEATPDFTPIEVHGVCVGFLIGSEAWALDEAARYGQENVHLLAMPRSARGLSLEEWLDHARAAATRSRAYVLSSNRAGPFGGQACIIAPDGNVLGTTSESEPFLTLNIELGGESGKVQGVRAPDWVDPWITGVPPY